MAQGDLTFFEDFARQLGAGIHNFGTDDITVALIDSTTDPTASDATPEFADYTEVSGGTYASKTFASDTWTEVTGTWKFDAEDLTWNQDGVSGPENIHWAIIYNNTATGDPCIGFVEMGNPGGTTPVSLRGGDISITWDVNGIFTVDA